jgi:hypothetical protein
LTAVNATGFASAYSVDVFLGSRPVENAASKRRKDVPNSCPWHRRSRFHTGGESPRGPRQRNPQAKVNSDFLGGMRGGANGILSFFVNGGMTGPMVLAISLQPWKPTFISRCGNEGENPLAPDPRVQ